MNDATLWILLGIQAYLTTGVILLVLLPSPYKGASPEQFLDFGRLVFLAFVALWPFWLILAHFGKAIPDSAGGNHAPRKAALIGHSGTAVTDLRPSGKVEVDGTIHDAQAATGFIAAGSSVKVVAAHAFGIEVRPVHD